MATRGFSSGSPSSATYETQPGGLERPVGRHVEGDAGLGVHHGLPARGGRLFTVRAARIARTGRLRTGLGGVRGLVGLVGLVAAEQDESGDAGRDDDGGGRDESAAAQGSRDARRRARALHRIGGAGGINRLDVRE
jgi:hypothetical protein